MRLLWPSSTTITDPAAAANRQKESPGRHRPGRGEVGHSTRNTRPKERQGTGTRSSVRPVCGESAKPCGRKPQKNGPERQIRGQADSNAHPEGKTQLRRAPAASARFVAGLWPSIDSFKIVEPRLPRDFSSTGRRAVDNATIVLSRRRPSGQPGRPSSKKPQPGCAVRVPLCKATAGASRADRPHWIARAEQQ